MSTFRALQPIPDDMPDLPYHPDTRDNSALQGARKESILSREGIARAFKIRRHEDVLGIQDLVAVVRQGLEGCNKKLLETKDQIKDVGIQEGFDDISYEIAAKVSAVESTRDVAKRYSEARAAWADLNRQFHDCFDRLGTFVGENTPGTLTRLKKEIEDLQSRAERLYMDVTTLWASTRPSNASQGMRMQSLSYLDRDIFVDPRLFLPSRYQRVQACEDELRKMIQDANEGRAVYGEDELI